VQKSTKQAFSVFDFRQKSLLLFVTICKKIFGKSPNRFNRLYSEFVELIEYIKKGVHIEKYSSKILLFSYTLNNQQIRVLVRRNGSDTLVFNDVILKEEYAMPVKAILHKTNAIVADAGANIGTTSIFIKSLIPAARIYAIEPDLNNFDLLKKNIAINKLDDTVNALRNAIWINDEKLEINNEFRDMKDWSLAVLKADSNSKSDLRGVALANLILDNRLSKIDLLKIDIEGAERFLFENSDFCDTIFRFVENLVIEIHDEFNVRDKINNKMNEMGFIGVDIFDLTFYSRDIKKNRISYK
jgi:FkbM family methyltransferase